MLLIYPIQKNQKEVEGHSSLEMKLNFDHIELKRKIFIKKGKIKLNENEITLITGKNEFS